MNSSLNGKAVFLKACFAVLAGLVLSVLYYAGFEIVRLVYEKEAGVLNGIITGQEWFSLDVYFGVFHGLFLRCCFISLCVFVVWVFSNRRWTGKLLFSSGLAGFLFMSELVLKHFLSTENWGWSAARLAWSFVVLAGLPLYPNIQTDSLLSTMYGPLTPLFYLPVCFFSSLPVTLVAGTVLSVVYYFLPAALLLRRVWQDKTVDKVMVLCAAAVFGLLTLAVPSLNMSAFFIHADAPAFCFSGLAVYFLLDFLHSDSRRSLFVSVLCATMAVWIKQVFLPVLILLCVYVFMRFSVNSRKKLLVYIFLLNGLMAGCFFFLFRWEDFVFNVLTMPLSYPWKFDGDLLRGFCFVGYELVRECFLILMGIGGVSAGLFFSRKNGNCESFSDAAVFLMLASILIPASLLGRIKEGGAINTLAPAVYFMALGLSVLVANIRFETVRSGRVMECGMALFVAVLVLLNVRKGIPDIAQLLVKLRNNDQSRVVGYLSSGKPGVYFPHYPLAGYFSDRRMYHFYYGIKDRLGAGFRVSNDNFFRHIPVRTREIVFPCWAGDTQAVMQYFPEYTRWTELTGLPGFCAFDRPEAEYK